MDVINTELMLADLDSVEKRRQKIEKMAKNTTDLKLKHEFEAVRKVHEALQKGLPARSVALDEFETPYAKELHLLSAKPVLYACNVNEEDFAKGGNPWVEAVKKRAQEEGNSAIVICSAMEAEIAELPKEEQKEFLSSIGATEPGMSRLIMEAYKLLGLQTYFTAGEKEVRAWTIRKSTKAPQAAGVIHTDFEKGFIRAECYHCEDLFQYKSETAVKEAGKYRSEGKEYVVKDGDILFFRFNV
jgi:GTP-binding protein YchF